jgi:hypothetical protein
MSRGLRRNGKCGNFRRNRGIWRRIRAVITEIFRREGIILAVCGENARRSARAKLKTLRGVCPKTVPLRREVQSAKFIPNANPRAGAHRHERVLEQAQKIKDSNDR